MESKPDNEKEAKPADQKSSPQTRKKEDSSLNDPGFIILEAHQNPYEMAGESPPPGSADPSANQPEGAAEASSSSDSVDDDFKFSTTADILEEEAHTNERPRDPMDFSGLMDDESSQNTNPDGGNPGAGDASAPSDQTPVTGVQRLSEERIREIESNLYGREEKSDYLTDEEKFSLVKKMGTEADADKSKKGFNSKPIVPHKPVNLGAQTKPQISPANSHQQNPSEVSPPAKNPTQTAPKAPSPRMANRNRGVAYFTRNIIQIVGEQELRDDDEMHINNREYVLRRKKVSSKFLMTVVAPLAAVLLFLVGVWFSSSADIGAGRIVGVVLDDQGRPYIEGGYIRLPELGSEASTTGQGLFRTEPIPAGSHLVEFIVDGQVVGSDYATVVDDRLTTIILEWNPRSAISEATAEPETKTVTLAQKPAVPSPRPVVSKPSAPVRTQAKPKPVTTSKATTPSWAKLQLEANIEGARVELDGKVLGAGNMTYTRLASGRHTYNISKHGYIASIGNITLKGGETRLLEVTLEPDASAQEEVVVAVAPPETNPADTYYDSGVEALESGDHKEAVADLSAAIAADPGHAEAYQARGAAYRATSKTQAAYDDYLRAAEIYRFARNAREAFACYNAAVELVPDHPTGYLGRGALFLARGEQIAAVTDFDMVVRIDKRDIRGYLGLGRARFIQGHYSKAAKHYKDARSIDPLNGEAHLSLMQCYLQDGEMEKLQKAYNRFMDDAMEVDQQRFANDPEYSAALKLVETN